MFLLLLVDLNNRQDFLLIFTSGLWALVPDLGWLLLRVGLPETATLWKTVFNSVFGLIFWFHPVLDTIEPDNRVYEMTGGFVLLSFAVVMFSVANDWEDDKPRRSVE